MSRAWWLLALALASGCKDREPARDDGAGAPRQDDRRGKPATGTPRPQPGLTVTVDGKPVTMQTAFAWREPDGTVEVLVSSVPRTCAEVTGSMREIARGEESFTFGVARKLDPDGTLGAGISWISYDANTSAGTLRTAKVTGDGAPEQPTTVTVDFEQQGAGFGDEPRKTIKVAGTVDALGCSVPVEEADRPPRPPAQAGTITAAGHTLPIAGALLESGAGDERKIVLSTGGASCDGFAHGEDGELFVNLHYKDAGDDVWQADLMGDWISGQQATQIFDGGRLVATPTRAPAGATTVELALSGKADIMGYPVALDGKVTARLCPAR